MSRCLLLASVVVPCLHALSGHAAPLPEGAKDGLAWQDPVPGLPHLEPLPAGAQFRLGQPTGQMTVVHVFSADGKTLAATVGPGYTGGKVFAIHLWDVPTGRYLRSLRGHDTGTMSVAFSPDGSLIGSGGIDNTLRFWDARTGKELGEPIRLPGHGYSVAFSPDGKRLAVGSTGLQLFDTATRKPIATQLGRAAGGDYIFEVVWAPDGKHFAAATSGSVRVWDAATGAAVQTFQDPRFGAHRTHLAFAAGGKNLLASGWPQSLLFEWEVASGKKLRELPAPRDAVAPERLCFAAEGKRLAWHQQLRQYDMASRTLVVSDGDGKVLCGIDSPSPVASLRLSPDGKRLAAGGMDGSLRLWDAATGKELRLLLDGAAEVFRLAYIQQGQVLRVLHTDATLREWDPTTGQELRHARFPLPPGEHLADASADGKFLATVAADGKLTLWSLLTGQVVARPEEKLFVRPQPEHPFGLRLPPGPRRAEGPPDVTVRFSGDGKALLALTGTGESIAVWDTATGKPRATIKVPAGATALTLSADGATLFTGGDQVQAWAVATGKPERTWQTQQGPQRQGLRWTRTTVGRLHVLDGKTLAVVETQHYTLFPPPPIPPGGRIPERLFSQVRLLDLGGQNAERSYALGEGSPQAFSADGRWLTSFGAGKLTLLDLSTGKAHETPTGSQQRVAWAAFRRDGKQLATALAGGVVLLWDAARLREK
jgi:WD40 repeat protein